MFKKDTPKLEIIYVPVNELKASEYNPRKWPPETRKELRKSVERFGMSVPLLVNCAEGRKNIVIGGNFRLEIAKEMGLSEVPVVYVNIPDIRKEKELNLRLNKNLGEWDWKLLMEFDEDLLIDVGFMSEELDEIFDIDTEHEKFNLEKELQKLNITKIKIKEGDVWKLRNSMICRRY